MRHSPTTPARPAILVLSIGLLAPAGWADDPPPDDATVALNLGQAVELQVLVDLVSTETGISVLYDEEIANKKLSVRAPDRLPVASLVDLLRSALRMKGFVLTEADAPGWLRIDKADKLAMLSRPKPGAAAGDPVTEVFRLKHADPKQIEQVIRPFLQQPGSNSVSLKEQRLVIVTDYASSLDRIGELIRTVDQPTETIEVEIYRARHVESADLAKQLQAVSESASVVSQEGSGSAAAAVQIVPDERTNQLLLIGPKTKIEVIRELADQLDVPLGMRTEVYPLANVGAERVSSLMEKLIDPLDAKRLFRSAIDADGNRLIVSTTDTLHRMVRDTIDSVDRPIDGSASPIRFYKLKHVTAEEALATILAIQGLQRPPTENAAPFVGGIRGVSGAPNVVGPNRIPAYPGQAPPLTPALREEAATPSGPAALAEAVAAPDSELLSQAQTAADPLTNSIIVVAEPEIQQLYEELILKLDVRRPQVLIEAKIVTLDVTDNYSLGIEISGGDRGGIARLFAFSSFGLSMVDPTTGALSLIPGTGFNGALLDSEDADAIIRALATHGRARVSSAPQVLVNDNATGTLTSVAEVPFTSVNASNTVATTSFAGYAEAGTSITATPHISVDNYLQLDYVVTLNSFTGAGGDGVPPPRQTDEIASTVTIPNGSTVVVGGLNRSSYTRDTSGLPGIERLPFGQLFGGTDSTNEASSALFVFLKPVILREDKFRDLKTLSKRPIKRSGIKRDAPTSRPLWMAATPR